jgi:hypothetical protein
MSPSKNSFHSFASTFFGRKSKVRFLAVLLIFLSSQLGTVLRFTASGIHQRDAVYRLQDDRFTFYSSTAEQLNDLFMHLNYTIF